MQPTSDRWHVVTDSQFPHERAGLEHVRALLPDRSPFHAWCNFEFVDRNGIWSEVDLLVLGEGALHLVELKHYQGEIRGDAYRWQLQRRSEDSPLSRTQAKARRLASVLQDAARSLGMDHRSVVPFVAGSVFLHAESTRCLIAAADRHNLYGLDGHESRSGLPSIAELLLAPAREARGQRPGERVDEGAFLRVIDKAGFALRREREVGSWRLIGPVGDEPTHPSALIGQQVWDAEHKVTRSRARIRFATTPRGASASQVEGTRQLVAREFALTSRLQHPGILAPQDIVEDELGTGLVFPEDPGAQRLDLWLADHADTLDLRTQVGLLRQLAEAVQYAHANGVVHRGLDPSAVLVYGTSEPRVRVTGWQVAGRAEEASTHQATRVFDRLDAKATTSAGRTAGAYVAPEGQWRPDADRVRLDVFALGALGYLLVTGRDPATSAVDLKERLAREDGLDLAADLPQVPAALRDLIRRATAPVVTERLKDANAFLEALSTVERGLGGGDIEVDPVDAPPGTVIGGRYEVVRRLGSGSTAVGLLVVDTEDGNAERVLKIAVDDDAATRLTAEAEVLTALRDIKRSRIVRIVEPEPVWVGDRLALVLESAGTETLADVLRQRGRLSIDLLERWGSDLLEALVSLDAAGFDHRDIKPANLGVRQQRSDRAEHLVLFDFSLAGASAAATGAGTPPYLDPFLGMGARQHWDSAAERYAAAVTLFEMATGHAPVYGDGQTAPQLAGGLRIAPGDFDAAVSASLTAFFTRALDPDARSRFGTASEMLTRWRQVFAASDATVPDDADARARRATLQTPLPDSGLTPRALSALEPLGLLTVADLVALEPSRLIAMAGIVDATKKEIRARAKQWRTRLGAQPAAPAAATATATTSPAPRTPPTIAAASLDPLADPADAVSLLVQAAGSPRAHAPRAAARALFGLDGEVDAFAVHSDFAGVLGLGGSPQVSLRFSKLREAWATHPEAAGLLDHVADRVVAALDGFDGIARATTVVAALAPGGIDPDPAAAGSAQGQAAPSALRLVAGLVRAALDRAEDLAREGDGEPAVVRRRNRAEGSIILARGARLLGVAMPLGESAARLVAAATAAGEPVVPRGRAVPALRRVWTSALPSLDDVRLVRLAARLSGTVRASVTGELFDPGMPTVDAIRLALSPVTPGRRYQPEEIASLVQARFPGVAAVPRRPGLDALLDEAGTGLVWREDHYSLLLPASATTFTTRTAVQELPLSPVPGAEQPVLRQLRDSVAARSFLALGVSAGAATQTAATLVTTFGGAEVNITDTLLRILRERAEQAGVPWDVVLAADAASAGTIDAQGLTALVAQCIPALEGAIAAALTGAPERDRPVVLTDAAPLARYGHLGVIGRLADITTPKEQAVWLVVPLDLEGSAPTLDGAPLPLTYASQFVRLDGRAVPEGALR